MQNKNRWYHEAIRPIGVNPIGLFCYYALIAQMVERRTENPYVGGSIPPQGTIKFEKGGTIMKKLIHYLILSKALTQVIVPAFTFNFFPMGK